MRKCKKLPTLISSVFIGMSVSAYGDDPLSPQELEEYITDNAQAIVNAGEDRAALQRQFDKKLKQLREEKEQLKAIVEQLAARLDKYAKEQQTKHSEDIAGLQKKITDNRQRADNAQSTANTAVYNASRAQSTANTAVTNAKTAQTTANTAVTNASSAQKAADKAQTTANANTKASQEADKKVNDAVNDAMSLVRHKNGDIRFSKAATLFLKKGNNGTVSCQRFCAGDTRHYWRKKTGGCIGSISMDDSLYQSIECNQIAGHSVWCICVSP